MISVVVPTIRPNTLSDAVNSILRQSFQDYELLIIGQGVNPNLQIQAQEMVGRDSRIRYIHVKERGLSRARNRGLAEAQGDIIAMMDDDCEAHREWLDILAQVFANFPAIGMVGGALIPAPKARFKIGRTSGLVPAEALYEPGDDSSPPEGFEIIGGNFAISRSAVRQIGQFDPYLGAGARFPAGEDTDYKLRMERHGIPMYSTPNAIVYHTHGWRYGLKAVLRHSRAYAVGNGALAAKLSLMNSEQGELWKEFTGQRVRDLLKSPSQWPSVPAAMRHNRFFLQAYRACCEEFRVGEESKCLVPLANKDMG